VAAIERQHGLQALAIEHLAARLAGGFLQPINSDSLKEAIGGAIAMDLGEFNDIKTLPGFPRAAAPRRRRTCQPHRRRRSSVNFEEARYRFAIISIPRL